MNAHAALDVSDRNRGEGRLWYCAVSCFRWRSGQSRSGGGGCCLGVCPGVLRAPLLPNPPLSPGASASATPTVTEPWIASCALPHSQPIAEGGWVPPCAACSQPPLPVGVPSLACLQHGEALGRGHALTYPALPAGAPPLQGPFTSSSCCLCVALVPSSCSRGSRLPEACRLLSRVPASSPLGTRTATSCLFFEYLVSVTVPCVQQSSKRHGLHVARGAGRAQESLARCRHSPGGSTRASFPLCAVQ